MPVVAVVFDTEQTVIGRLRVAIKSAFPVFSDTIVLCQICGIMFPHRCNLAIASQVLLPVVMHISDPPLSEAFRSNSALTIR